MELGWNTYYFTLPYHFEREPNESLFSGEYMVSAHLERTVQASKQAVVDLRQLINWVKITKRPNYSNWNKFRWLRNKFNCSSRGKY